MIYIESPSHDPAFNLALEEYLFFQKQEEIFMLWQNADAIIIGKNQNAMAEIDYTYVTEHHIPVVRRLSGGGAVYHDLGNVNFTYIVNREAFGDYVGFTKTLRDFLASKGLSAEVSGRNDVLVDGRKISGNAQFCHHGRLLHHGTILVDANMEKLGAALKPDKEKIQSKGVRSVESRVRNLGSCLSMDGTTFLSAFREYVLESEQMPQYDLTEADIEAVKELEQKKYSTYDWNFGYSPKYNFHSKKRFAGGGIEVYLDVHEGIIRDAKIYGDFLDDATPLAEKLVGKQHNFDTLQKDLEGFSLGTITPVEILSCLL